MEINEYYDYLVNYGIATEQEIDLVTSINGYNEDTLNDILYVKSGYRDLEQYTEYEDIEYYNEHFKEEE